MEKGPKDETNIGTKAKLQSKRGQAKTIDLVSQGYDDIIGSFGKYQFLIFMFKILIGVTSAFNNLGVTFFAPTGFISYWCADSPIQPLTPPTTYGGPYVTSSSTNSNLTYSLVPTIPQPLADNYISNHSLSTATHHDNDNEDIWYLLNGFMSGSERKQKHNLNLNYDTPKNLRKECYYLSPVDNKQHKCTSYKYDTGIWISTIIDEWDLVCNRSWFISMAQSLYMAGFIISYLVFGYLSDRFGRWNSLLIGASIEVLSGFGCAFAGSITQFMIFRFLIGLGNAGRSSSSYLIMIEWTGASWRMHISTLGSIGWAIGYCLLPWITTFFLHFRHMQMFVCMYEIIFIIWLLRIPESPRWLLTHRRFNEAYDVLLMAAKFNGLIKKSNRQSDELSTDPSLYAANYKTLGTGNGTIIGVKTIPAKNPNANIDIEQDKCSRVETMESYTLEEFDLKFQRLSSLIEAKEFTKKEGKLSIIDLFKWKNLRKYTLIFCFAWAVNSFIYYGIALNVGDFGAKNLFIAFTFAGITELPSIVFTIVCMKFLPRKTTNVFLFITIFALCAIQVPLKYYDYQWLQQVTMMLAKLFNTCSFTCILYQSMELFPTSIRQTAYGSCALAGRIGSILAPFIKELSQKTNNLVPPVIYAALSLMEIVFIRNLPETQGSDLPDTLLEAENFKGTDRRPS